MTTDLDILNRFADVVERALKQRRGYLATQAALSKEPWGVPNGLDLELADLKILCDGLPRLRQQMQSPIARAAVRRLLVGDA